MTLSIEKKSDTRSLKNLLIWIEYSQYMQPYEGLKLEILYLVVEKQAVKAHFPYH